MSLRRLLHAFGLAVFLVSLATAMPPDLIVQEDESGGVVLQPAPLTPAQLLAFADAPTTAPALRPPDLAWVDDVLSSMTLEEKIGQMIMSSNHAGGEGQIDAYHVGGFVFVGNGQQASNIVATTNRLQAYSPIPLWFSIDAEAGLGARVADATIYPLIMAFGAAGDPALTELCGHITARECRALGVQIAFGPVVDVNTEPINPIISTRSYADDPDLVTDLARGFITGARAEGLLCTFKHYPGHGATTGDSHSSLPTVDLPLATLEAEHIKPYRDLAGTGDVDLVMSAHVWYSQVDNDYGKPWPATLSPRFLTDILRTSIGFDNVTVSDAYGMSGLALAVPDQRERAVKGVQAGLDVILMPPDVGEAFNGIRDAVLDSTLTIERIDESVRRILIAKSRSGLPENALVDPALYPTVLRHPEHLSAVRQVCERAFTCAKDQLSNIPPVSSTDHVLVLSLTASRTIFYRMSSTYFTNPFVVQVPNTDIQIVGTSLSTSERQAIVNDALLHDKVIVLGYDWTEIASSNQVTLINDLAATSVPVIYVAFGAPYHYLQIPGVDAFYCGYSSVDAMQEVAVEVLTGQRQAVGVLPVQVAGLPVPPNRVDVWLSW